MINLPNIENQKGILDTLTNLNKTLAYSSDASYTRNIVLKQGEDVFFLPGQITVPPNAPTELLKVEGKGRFLLFVPQMTNDSQVVKLEVILDGVETVVFNAAASSGSQNKVYAYDGQLVYREGTSLIVNFMNYKKTIDGAPSRETIFSNAHFDTSLVVRATSTYNPSVIRPTIVYSLEESGE